MNRVFRKVLTISILLVFAFVTAGAAAGRVQAVAPLPDSVSGQLVGAGEWGRFLSGVGCGAGIVLMASGYASGIGSIGALLLTVTTLRACASALE